MAKLLLQCTPAAALAMANQVSGAPFSPRQCLQALLQSLDRELHGTGHFGFFNGTVTFKVGVEVYTHVLTILPAAILGLVCGAFAVAFTRLNLTISRWRARVVKPREFSRLLEVLVMTLVYVGVCMLLPHFFPCRATECTVPKSDTTVTPTCPESLVHSNDTLLTTNEDLALVRSPYLQSCLSP
jgi:H+/Cl- antiporter ClcA